jgi:hypothetical protein
VRGWYARDYFNRLKSAAEAKLCTELKRDEITFLKNDEDSKMNNILWMRQMTESQMSLKITTGIQGIYDNDKVQSTDDEIQKVFEPVKYDSAHSDYLESLSIDLLRVPDEPVEGKSQEESEVDNLFAFIGDFDPTLRTAQMDGADTLALMANNLFDEIEGLFEEEEEELEDEDEEYQEEEESYHSSQDSESQLLSGDNSHMGSMEMKRVLRNNPLVNAEEARNRASITDMDPNQKWTMIDFAEKFFFATPGKKVSTLLTLSDKEPRGFSSIQFKRSDESNATRNI